MFSKNLDNNTTSGKFCFLILSLSLLVGFYFNEDASGGGAASDFYFTWNHVLALKENLFVDGSEWSMHFPLHHIILSRLNFLINDRYLLRLFFCIVSILVPLLFYLNLKIKFDFINRNILWFLASLIFLFPAFRYSAIWANDHITAFIFFLLATLFFLKWNKKIDYENLDLNIILQTIFLALAAKAKAFIERRGYVIPQDIRDIGKDILRHRIILSYEAEAEEITTDDIITRLYNSIPTP